TSIGGWQGVSGFLGYDEPNLFGQAKEGHLRWEYGRYVNNFEASYTDPAISGSRVSGSASVFRTHPRLFRLPGGSYLRTGTSLRFGVPLPIDPYIQFTLGYSFSRTEYETSPGTDENQSVFNLPPGDLSTVSLGLRRSTLDHPLFPTQGTRQRLLADLSGGVFGGQGDFQKYTVEGNWWVPVGEVGGSAPDSRPLRFALGLSVDAGALFGERASLDRFPFERFFMGGVQFGEPLRGYGETEITPDGYVPEGGGIANRLGDAYLKLSAEYAIRFNDNLSASLFYDAGNVWRNPSQVNPTELFRGAGFGLTLVTPFGPLGLDLGYGFDRDEPGWELHFKFGQAF
ncbi:MAG: BamA/OMP85 family outer membrane protein, partial [Gemmatimonadota bacterium]